MSGQLMFRQSGLKVYITCFIEPSYTMIYTNKLAPYWVKEKGIIIKLICFTLILKSAYQKLSNAREDTTKRKAEIGAR